MTEKEVKSILLNHLHFSQDALYKLDIFSKAVIEYNLKFNLISKSTINQIWDRHILDSAQLVKYIDFEDKKSLSDLGSGAGFPGLILAIFNKNPNFHVKLYEKSNIKADFLENIKNKLNIECEILGRYQDEEIVSEYVVSRAFKKLDEILRISRETIKVNHKLIILKGKNAEAEINKLLQPLEFIYKLEKSITDPTSKILIVDIKK